METRYVRQNADAKRPMRIQRIAGRFPHEIRQRIGL
jgi:hypothetical protein